MIREDYHVHTTYCDGRNSVEEMVQAAIAKGMTTIGFSGHSPIPGEESWCMTEEGMAQYRQDVAAAKKKYAGQIKILCGVEQDSVSTTGTEGFDYIIGAVHMLRFGDDLVSVDDTAEEQIRVVETYCGGDFQTFAEAYYDALAHVVETTHCDIVAHFDEVTKFNEGDKLFDTHHPRYVAAWKRAADALLKTGAVFEINTGAITRGYRTTPYPAPEIRAYLQARGAKFIWSSDSHRADTLLYGFPQE